MDLLSRPQGISLPLAPVIAGSIGFAVAIVVGTLPPALFEGLVMASGLPAILAAAEPPLGLTARLLVTLALAGLVTALVHTPLSFVYGRRRLRVRNLVERDEIHIPPSKVATPAPRPILAQDELGAPFLSITAGPSRPKTAKPDAKPVTETVEIAGGVFIPERRRHPRAVPPPRQARDPVFDQEPTVANLLARLESALSSQQIGSLRDRPLDPGFRAAVEALRTTQQAG